MTKFEVCQTVLADNTRSADDRAKAVALLKRIADDVGDPNCAEARRLLATLPLSQEAEDAMIVRVLDFKDPNPHGAYRPSIYPDYSYEPRLKELVTVLRADPIFIDGWHRQPGYAVQCVADLEALYERTKSDRIRGAVVDQLTRIAKWHTDEAIRAASRKALTDITEETN